MVSVLRALALNILLGGIISCAQAPVRNMVDRDATVDVAVNVDARSDATPTIDAADRGTPDAPSDSQGDGEVGPPPCPSGERWCGEACVDVETDPSHCGMCGRECMDGWICVNGNCRRDRR